MVQSKMLQQHDMLLFFKRGHQDLTLIHLTGLNQSMAGKVTNCTVPMGEDHIGVK